MKTIQSKLIVVLALFLVLSIVGTCITISFLSKQKDDGVVINLAGKQRMLTQKMAKELLLLANGIEPDKNRRNLKKTTSLFERSLKGLQVGDKDLGLPGTEEPDISEPLELIEELWNEYKSVLSKIISGDSNTVPQETLVKAARVNLPLLREMNKAVKMYEESVKIS